MYRGIRRRIYRRIRRALSCGFCIPGGAYWVMLACAPYIGVVEITENFRGYFARVWAAVGWVRGEGVDFGTLAKGCSRTCGLPSGYLWALFEAKFWKNLKKICGNQSGK